jgi:hypothetical protein
MAQPCQVVIETPDHHRYAVDAHVHAGSIIETPDHHKYVLSESALSATEVVDVVVPVLSASDSQVEDPKTVSASQVVDESTVQDDTVQVDALQESMLVTDSCPPAVDMYQPRLVIPNITYAAPTVPVTVAPVVYVAAPVYTAPPVYAASPAYAAPPVYSSAVLPVEPAASPAYAAPPVYSSAVLPVEPTRATFMWNGTEYDSYDAAVEAMTMHLVPKVDAEESNADDAHFPSNEDPIVEVTKPGNATRVRVVKKKKGCC